MAWARKQSVRNSKTQKFIDKFFSKVHSLTVADVHGKSLTIRQLTAGGGQELDRFRITK